MSRPANKRRRANSPTSACPRRDVVATMRHGPVGWMAYSDFPKLIPRGRASSGENHEKHIDRGSRRYGCVGAFDTYRSCPVDGRLEEKDRKHHELWRGADVVRNAQRLHRPVHSQSAETKNRPSASATALARYSQESERRLARTDEPLAGARDAKHDNLSCAGKHHDLPASAYAAGSSHDHDATGEKALRPIAARLPLPR